MNRPNSYFWNYLDLPTPVILSIPLNCSNAYAAVSKLRTVMTSIRNTLNDLKQLNLEAAALSRLIYRTKYKFRQEKSFKTLQMINRCLTNYLSIHLPFTVNSIQDTLVDDRGPTRQMLEWTLVRILSVAHLFNRVYSLCTLAAGHLFVRLKLMHMYEITLFAVAVVSRIWTMAQFLVRKACEWYDSLHPYLDKLQPSPHPWLPSGAVLPSTLAATLGQPDYLTLKSVCKPDELISQLDPCISETDKSQINGNLLTIIDVDDIGETVSRNSAEDSTVMDQKLEELLLKLPKNNRNASRNKTNSLKLHPHILDSKERLNVRESSPPFQKNSNTTKPKGNCNLTTSKTSECGTSYKHSIKGIRSSEDLLKFLEIESALRNSSSNPEITHQPLIKNCDKLQWSMMEKFMKKQIKLLCKSEKSGNLELREKLLKRVRKNIKSMVS